MKHTDISVNMLLRLKPDRVKAYGMDRDTVTVTAIKPRPGYSVPFVYVQGLGYFKPS